MIPVRMLPRLEIRVGGDPLDPADASGLVAIRVRHRACLPSQCELTFVDAGGPLGDAVAPGVALRVALADQPGDLFEGEVTVVEYRGGPTGARELRVRGYDRLHRLRKRQPVRAHVGVTLGGLATELTGEDGLEVEGGRGSSWHYLVQDGVTDFDLLAGLAARAGRYFTLDGHVLRFYTLEGRGEPVSLELGRTLLQASVEVSGEGACREVTAFGWHPHDGEGHRGTASRAQVGRDVRAEAPPGDLGGTADRTLADTASQDASHAEAAAQAELDRRAAAEVVLRGTAEGDTDLLPGARVDVSGVSARVDGRYVLTEVVHRVEPDLGFVSEISTAPVQPPRRRREAGATLGVVTRVDDPDGLGRVRVRLPTFNDVETDWMQVVCPGAGADKGFVALPDVGDAVMLLLSHDDPSRGAVLGGLYGSGGAPDPGVAGGRVRRYTWRTPGGQLVRLDDEHHTLRVEDGHGSYLEMTRSAVKLHAAEDLTIEAPGKKLVIKASNVDFQRE